jgi:hypothetical protein
VGLLTYPMRGLPPMNIDDRALAHLQVVIGSKLRQRQSFFLSWIDGSKKGGGHTSIWIDPTIQLAFTYDTNQRHHINRSWLDSMMASANSATGLLITDEPQGLAIADEHERPDTAAA